MFSKSVVQSLRYIEMCQFYVGTTFLQAVKKTDVAKTPVQKGGIGFNSLFYLSDPEKNTSVEQTYRLLW